MYSSFIARLFWSYSFKKTNFHLFPFVNFAPLDVLWRLSLLLILFVTSSCVETIIGASLGATYLSSREKNIKNTAIDVKISSQIAANFVVNGLKNPGNSVDVTVSEGRVLLTGIVRSTKKARLAIDIAWKAKDVKEVIDEIQKYILVGWFSIFEVWKNIKWKYPIKL